MEDRIITATARDGSLAVAAGITTELVREARRRHDLAPTASAALGRLLTAAALLGATLRGQEIVALQVAGDGPLGRLFAEARLLADGALGVRGYVDRPHADLPLNSRGKFDVGAAVGTGRLQV
ncbi:MAG: Hsp33 family molecular chaperone HslO, partial [Vulcanimicrobiaceae bacterium]